MYIYLFLHIPFLRRLRRQLAWKHMTFFWMHMLPATHLSLLPTTVVTVTALGRPPVTLALRINQNSFHVHTFLTFRFQERTE